MKSVISDYRVWAIVLFAIIIVLNLVIGPACYEVINPEWEAACTVILDNEGMIVIDFNEAEWQAFDNVSALMVVINNEVVDLKQMILDRIIDLEACRKLPKVICQHEVEEA